MIKKLFSLFIVSLLIISGISLELVEANNQIPQKPIDSSDITKLSSGFFTENKGQWDSEFLYMGDTSFGKVAFAKDAIYYQLIKTEKRSEKDINCVNPIDRFAPMCRFSEEQEEKFEYQIIKLSFVNPQTPKIKPEGLLTHYNNYFIGNDPNKWAKECHNYTKVYYEDIWNGIDLAYFFNNEGLKYEFYAKPCSNISNIKIDVQGADLELENNKLKIDTPIGSLFDSKLISYTEESNKRINVSFSKENNTYGFQIEPNFKTNETIIIDPLVYSTFLGGTSSEYSYYSSIAADSAGNAYVSGYTYSSNFPTTPGAYDTSYYNGDAFITKLNPTGTSLVYSTFVGGNNTDLGYGIAIDYAGCACITGYTYSTDFPTSANAYSKTLKTGPDTYAFKLNSTGTALVYSTYLGGNNTDLGYGIAIDSQGNNIYITGYTYSTDFPISADAYSKTLMSGPDVFVSKLYLLGSGLGSGLVYSTYLGGTSSEYGYGIAVDSAGNAYVAGYTGSSNFPTTPGAYDTTLGSSDAFITKLNPTGTALVYSTFVGGSSTEYGNDIAIDSSGNAYITGYTYSSDFPTSADAYSKTLKSGPDTFVFKLNSTGKGLVYSTYLGGNSTDIGYSIAVDYAGNAYITGYTYSTDLPTSADAYSKTFKSGCDVFVSRFNSTGTQLIYSTYLGGSDYEYGYGIAVDSSGNAYVAGYTYSTDFPVTPGAYDTTLNSYEVFVTKISLFIPPSSPSLEAILNYDTVYLSWNKPTVGSHPIKGYQIYRAISPSVDYQPLVFLDGVDTTSYADSSGLFGNTYSYYVVAVDVYGIISIPSNIVAVGPVTPVPPSRPSLEAILNYDTVYLSWSKSTKGTYPIKGYQIYRADVSDGIYIPLIFLDGVNKTSYADSSGLFGNTYSYYVVAVDETGITSIPSNIVTVGPVTPVPPSSPSPLQGVSSFDTVYLLWSKSTEGTYPIKGYQIYRANVSDGIYIPLIFLDGVNTTSYADSSGLFGNTYSYYVVAVDETGITSIPSNIVTVGPVTPALPSRPSLDATLDFDTVYLSWSKSTKGTYPIKGYRIYRANVSDRIYQPIIFLDGVDSTSYVDTSGLFGNTYSYFVVAVDINGNTSIPSNVVIIGPLIHRPGPVPPSSPSPLIGVLNYNIVYLSWNKSREGTYLIKGYQIYRANVSDGIYQSLAFVDGIDSTSYTDTTGLVGNTYSYYVVAVDINGNTSIPSNSVIFGPLLKPQPSLYLSPELNRKEYYPGDEVIIKLSIMNKGNEEATDVKLIMVLPQDIEYVKADLLRGSVFGNSVEFNVGKILREDTFTFHIFCKVKSNIRNDKSIDIIFDVTCKENSTDRKAVHLLIKSKRGEVKPLSIGIYLKNVKPDPDTGEYYIDFETSLELTLKIDGGSAPYTLNIDWGDGSSKEEKKVDSAEINLTHKFESRGTIEIKFEVTDSVGRTKKATTKLKVK